jgi:predicted nucleotidyltransferase
MTAKARSDFSPGTLLDRLREAGVEYVVIGGLAAVFHGASHVTGDLDVCYNRDRENLRRLSRALQPLSPRLRGAPPDLPFKLDERTLRAGLNFTLTTDAGDLDLIGEVSGIGHYEQVLSYSERVEVGGETVRILSLEGLILSKRAAGREKDRILLRELEIIRRLRSAE